ncbi:MAG: class I SAM-dependent methyltransferase [Candidatus Latescibacteria bacterium]|jgi:ubiquinone/menaquinone biosynthesis C-methylase UbiE|nr:hypothetical protein [Gemmatimonadaceae bacterium]MDP6014814.1 class I SAM-dependent methyltransferase [Candidatus Latescibacterota bacterium]MDP7448252.1 class I SAM-dependent methyltransferase [Candidatus Latescibacterota bacterium]HJP34214.1 class I SAM-dependent methyltransferase [Candidatus Latescibacterota bacterium]
MSTGHIFSAVADTYDRYPRQFSPALYERIASLCPPTPDTCVLDVGCGTGTTTYVLAESYPRTLGLEPSAALLRHASSRDGAILWLQGIAEQMPLADHGFDLITAAQAFHWFDGDVFLAEARRILKPGGTIALFWKGPERGEPYRRLLERTIDERLHVSKLRTPLADVEQSLSASGLTNVRMQEFVFDIEWTVESYVGSVSSTSRMAQLDEEQRAQLIPHLRAALLEETGQDRFTERNVASLFTARNPS